MRSLTLVTVGIALLVACGGDSAPASTPEPAAKKVEAAPPPAEPEPAAEPDFASLSDEDKVAKLMEVGKNVYETGGSAGIACQTCHQANGQGMEGAFPPLVGAKDWMGDCAKHAGHILKGLNGEIEVAGKKYNGVMPAQPTLTDLEIAGAITYERMSWGNDYGACMPEAVAALR